MKEVATMFLLSKLRKDREARSEICPECEPQSESPARGEPLVRSVRTTVAPPLPRVA